MIKLVSETKTYFVDGVVSIDKAIEMVKAVMSVTRMTVEMEKWMFDVEELSKIKFQVTATREYKE